MKTLHELINTEDPGITVLHEWLQSAIRPVELLSIHSKKVAEEALLQLQVTTRSPLGAIVYETGGMLIDKGWIRVLGGGTETLPSSYQWNKDKTIYAEGKSKGYYIIAYDVLGGYFCINSGSLGSDIGKIYYFAPDMLDFEPLDVSYSDLIYFFIAGHLDQFYQDFRWTTWKEDTAELTLDKAFHVFPPLWTKEGKNIDSTAINPISAEELYHATTDFKNGLNTIEDKYL